MDAKLIRRVKRWDKLADRVITGGGLFVIICVLGILVLIAQVAIPLFLPPQATVLGSFLPASGQGTALAVGTDDYLESAWQLTPEGVFSFHRLPDGAPLESLILEHPEGASRLLQANPYGRQRFSLAWDNGAVSVVRLVLRTEFSDTGARRLVRSLEVLVSAPPLTALSPASPVPVAIPTPPHSSILTRVPVNTPRMLARAADPSGEHAGSYTRVVLRDASSLFVEKVSVQTSLLGEAESDHRVHVLETGVPGAISALTLDEAGNILFAGTSDGHLLRWDLSDLETPVLKDRLQAFPDGRAITTLALLLGDVTLLVGDSRGGVSGWFPVPQAQGELKSLALIHRLLPHSGPVVSFQPGNRSKTAASLGSSGATRLDHLTSENTLLSLEGDNPQRLGSFSPRDDAFAALDDSGRITVWTLRIPHPEVSWGTYFSPQWYENYPKPDYVWQSSSGSDDSEPKLSLMPLVFGTLKGTFWGMLFAAPLAILSA
ncbi:MAG: ABC transporter permease, partial [Deltaproteobacteria bacterium]|nr:ABC transporter permease [Deltaproteobacteria bacterium]